MWTFDEGRVPDSMLLPLRRMPAVLSESVPDSLLSCRLMYGSDKDDTKPGGTVPLIWLGAAALYWNCEHPSCNMSIEVSGVAPLLTVGRRPSRSGRLATARGIVPLSLLPQRMYRTAPCPEPRSMVPKLSGRVPLSR